MLNLEKQYWILNDIITTIYGTMKEKLDIMPKPWQVSVIIDRVYKKKNVIILTGIRFTKILLYNLLFSIKKKSYSIYNFTYYYIYDSQDVFTHYFPLLQIIATNCNYVNHY